MSSIKSNIKNNLAEIRKNILTYSKGRPVKLVAVTKQATVSQMRELLSLGVDCIGESRVVEAADKFAELGDLKFEKHLIGHLQTNKARLAVKTFDVIQSVDSVKLAKSLDEAARDFGKVMPVFIEVNIAGEDTKCGVPPTYVPEFYNNIIKFQNLRVEGLMAIAPLFPPENIEKTRAYFKKMRQLNDALKLKWLSMGMSNDYTIAIEEGANMVRIGSALLK